LYQILDDTHFNLLVFGQPPGSVGSLDWLGDRLRVHAIPVCPENDAVLARAKIPQPSFYLLRPDGHVGLCGTRLDASAITRYLVDRVRLNGADGRPM
jgi:hypothetical protein